MWDVLRGVRRQSVAIAMATLSVNKLNVVWSGLVRTEFSIFSIPTTTPTMMMIMMAY